MNLNNKNYSELTYLNLKKLITFLAFICYTAIYAQYERFGEPVEGIEVIALQQETSSDEIGSSDMETTERMSSGSELPSRPVITQETDFYGGTKGAFSVSLSGAAT